jgi:hypothetical protein
VTHLVGRLLHEVAGNAGGGVCALR